MKFITKKGKKSRILRMKHPSKYFYRIWHHDIVKFLLIQYQKFNYQGQKFIILNFSEYKVLKMKF